MATIPVPSPRFPPLDWLGYGLNLARVDPFSLRTVESAKTQVRIVDTTKDTRIQRITIDGVEYEVPAIVSGSKSSNSRSFQRTFTNGDQAVADIRADASLADGVLSLSTNSLSLLPLNKSLPTRNQYFFFGNINDAYTGNLVEYTEFLNEEELLKYIPNLPPFDQQNPDAVQAYADFFDTVGSHFILNTTFGARFQLEVWALNKFQEVNNNFVRDVTASVKGLNNGGEFDSSVINEPQYETFQRISQRIIRIRGGSTNLADDLFQSPDYTTYERWRESILGNPELVTLRASELWTLLRFANDATLRSSASQIQNAFQYLSSVRSNLPNDKHTWFTFETESRSSEFGILTANTIIGNGDGDPATLPQLVALGPAKLHREAERSSRLPFTAVVDVIGDGTPVDIYVSSASGSASLNILGRVYSTDGGTKWYYDVPVTL